MNLLTLAQSEQHIYGFEGTTSAAIFVAGFTGLLILAALTVRINIRLWVMAGMLFATALTAPVDFDQLVFFPTWMLSVQQQRAQMHLALGVLFTIMALASGRVGARHVSFQSVILLLMSVYMAMLMYIHSTSTDATQSLLFALATIPCMVIGVPPVTRTHEQCVAILKTMMMVSVVWTFCCSVQFVINPRYLVNPAGRFWGMLANAQQAAFLVAPFCIISLWLLMHDPRRRTKILWGTLLAINLLFLIWTGSRTGGVMLLLGSMVVLGPRIGRAVALLPVVALIFWGLYVLSDFLQIGSSIEHITSSENTRAGVWSKQIETALTNPLLGVGWNESIGGSESSYFGGFAAYGIVLFMLMVGLLCGSIALCVSLVRGRRWLPAAERPLVDMFVAFNAMYFGGAAFEGYILARSSTTLVMALMFAGIGVYLKEQIALNRDAYLSGSAPADYEHADGVAEDEGEAAYG